MDTQFWQSFEGQTVDGKYRLQHLLGNGAFGGVFLTHETIGRQVIGQVAVKLILPLSVNQFCAVGRIDRHAQPQPPPCRAWAGRREVHSAESPSQAALSPETRVFSLDEFETDTQEYRSIAVLAEKRRQFLARLGAHTDDTPGAE